MTKETPQKQVWESGDWKLKPNPNVPYNGIKISGLSTYNDNQQLKSVEVCFSDYTYNPKGVNSIIKKLTLADSWTIIPNPKQVNKETTTTDFSINGKVTLEIVENSIYLKIHLYYGPKNSINEAMGFIFQV